MALKTQNTLKLTRTSMIWGFRNPRKPRKLCSDLETKKPGGPRKPSGEHENLKRRDLENLKSLINLTV